MRAFFLKCLDYVPGTGVLCLTIDPAKAAPYTDILFYQYLLHPLSPSSWVSGNRLPYVLRISPLLQFVNSTHPLNNYKNMSKYCRLDEVLRKSGASNTIDGKRRNVSLADVI